MSLFTKTGLAPNWAGEFSSYQQWVNKGASWLKSPDHRRAVCIDDKGRRVTCGGDFALARDEGAFPVRFFWDCMPQAVAPSVASAAKGDELPPLPKPAAVKQPIDDQPGVLLFSSKQMRAYARAAVLAEREAIARQADSAGHHWSGAPAIAFFELAERIRARN